MTEDELRAKIIAEARSWLDTPHIHQACQKGVGVDCAMLIRAVGEACGVVKVEPAQWQRFEAYGRRPNPTRMREALQTFLVQISDGAERPGDIMFLDWQPDRELPMHLALLAEIGSRRRPTMIHALARPGRIKATGQAAGRVVEHGFVAEWPGRVDSWWRYPGLAETVGAA